MSLIRQKHTSLLVSGEHTLKRDKPTGPSDDSSGPTGPGAGPHSLFANFGQNQIATVDQNGFVNWDMDKIFDYGGGNPSAQIDGPFLRITRDFVFQVDPSWIKEWIPDIGPKGTIMVAIVYDDLVNDSALMACAISDTGDSVVNVWNVKDASADSTFGSKNPSMSPLSASTPYTIGISWDGVDANVITTCVNGGYFNDPDFVFDSAAWSSDDANAQFNRITFGAARDFGNPSNASLIGVFVSDDYTSGEDMAALDLTS